MKNKKLFYDKNTQIITIKEIENSKSFKEKLKENKIYFDTIVMTFLSIIGLALTALTIIIYNKQLEIEKALAMPIINLLYDNSDDIIDKITVMNNGAIINNFVVEAYPFLYVNILSLDEKYFLEDKNIPVLRNNICMFPLLDESYESLITKTSYNNAQGILATIEISNDSLIIQDMNKLKDITNYSENDFIEITYLEIKYFLFVSYTNVLGNEISNYYCCSTGIHIGDESQFINKMTKKVQYSGLTLLQEQSFYYDFFNDWVKNYETGIIYKPSENDSEEIRLQKLIKAILNPDNYYF